MSGEPFTKVPLRRSAPPGGVVMELHVQRDGHPCWVVDVVLDKSYALWPEAVQYALEQMVGRAIADNFPREAPE